MPGPPPMDDDDRLAFRFDCGATWLNLLATSGRTFSAHPVERIATPERLSEWLGHCELTPTEPPGATGSRTDDRAPGDLAYARLGDRRG
jgi:Putative stress-induced transcription regulator